MMLVTYIMAPRLRDLRQVHLIQSLSIAQTIFTSIVAPITLTLCNHIVNITLKSHFKVDADPAVQGLHWEMNTHVRDPNFDDLC